MTSTKALSDLEVEEIGGLDQSRVVTADTLCDLRRVILIQAIGENGPALPGEVEMRKIAYPGIPGLAGVIELGVYVARYCPGELPVWPEDDTKIDIVQSQVGSLLR